MRGLTHVSLLAVLLGSVAVAADPVPPAVVVVPRVPSPKWSELKVPSGQHVTLSAGAGTKAAKWVLIDAGGADLTTAGQTATFSATAPGRYRVIAFLDGQEPLLTTLVVGDGPPAPPGPPDPLPPPPDSPLRKKLRAAFDADAAGVAAKRDQAKDLAALYRQAAVLAASSDVPTSGELLRRVREAAATLLKPDELVGVRRIVADELILIFAADAELTPEHRKAAATLFADLAACLDSF